MRYMPPILFLALETIRRLIIHLYMVFRRPHLLRAAHDYRFSDYDLKATHILEALNYAKVAGVSGSVIPLTYFEFGCHSARTFCAAMNAASYLKSNFEFFAFDSFQGLPETTKEEDGIFEKGQYNTSRRRFLSLVRAQTKKDLDENQIIEGFFEDTLTDELANQLPNIGVLHIDVDLYLSTVKVLSFVKPLLVPGTVVLFDDWNAFPGGSMAGERRAFLEFLEQNEGIQVEKWKSYSTFGQSFFVVSNPYIRMKSD